MVSGQGAYHRPGHVCVLRPDPLSSVRQFVRVQIGQWMQKRETPTDPQDWSYRYPPPRTETRTLGLDHIHNLQKVFQASSEAVILCDNNHVSGPKLGQEPVQLGANPRGSGDGVCKNAFRTGGSEGVALVLSQKF